MTYMVSLVILMVLALLNTILFLGMMQVFFRNKNRHFYYAGFFFLACGLAQIEQFILEYGVPAPWAVLVNRLQALVLIAFIYLIPFFAFYFTREKIRNSYRLGLSLFSFILYGLTLFTDLVIKHRSENRLGYLEGEHGILYSFVMFLIALVGIYYLIRITLYGRRHLGNRNFFVILSGILITILTGLMTFYEVTAQRTVLRGVPEPIFIGLGALSFSFAWIILTQYSSLFSSLDRSQAEARALHDKTDQSLMEFIELVAKTLDAKDPYTAGHSLRVRDYALQIAQALKLPKRDQELLNTACLLHDIGKISIPDGILNKKSALSAHELEHIYRHPVVGRQILSSVSDFEEILDIIYYHHERVDGKGYPKGLTKHEIPLLARIIAVADTYDAITSERVHRRGRGRKDAAQELKKIRGTQLDEEIVDAFLRIIKG
jgi:putative nucleotidyltransferase with HDIG domain